MPNSNQMSPVMNTQTSRIGKDSIITKTREESHIPQDEIFQQNADLMDNTEGNNEFD